MPINRGNKKPILIVAHDTTASTIASILAQAGKKREDVIVVKGADELEALKNEEGFVEDRIIESGIEPPAMKLEIPELYDKGEHALDPDLYQEERPFEKFRGNHKRGSIHRRKRRKK